MTRPVEVYRPVTPDKDFVEAKLDYPGELPPESYFTNGTEVTVMSDDFGKFTHEVDTLLEASGLPSMAERVPVVAYGSNRNPYRLFEKAELFKDGIDDSLAPMMHTVPAIKGVIDDAAVVWHGKPGQNGATFAELSPEPGSTQEVHVDFLAKEQLAVMTTTEGVTYRLVETQVQVEDSTVATGTKIIPALMYVAGQSTQLVKDGKPVRVAGTTADSEALTAEQAVDTMLDAVRANKEETAPSARDLIEEWKGKPLAYRKGRQAEIAAGLARAGSSVAFSHPGALNRGVGRADFNSLPNSSSSLQAHRNGEPLALLEQSFAPGFRPSPQEIYDAVSQAEGESDEDYRKNLRKKRLTLDPLAKVRGRASDDIGGFNNMVAAKAGEYTDLSQVHPSDDGISDAEKQVLREVYGFYPGEKPPVQIP